MAQGQHTKTSSSPPQLPRGLKGSRGISWGSSLRSPKHLFQRENKPPALCNSRFVPLPLPWVCNPTWACSYLRQHHKGKNIGQTKGWNKLRQGLEKAHTQRLFKTAARMQRRFKEKEAVEKGSQTNKFQLGFLRRLIRWQHLEIDFASSEARAKP